MNSEPETPMDKGAISICGERKNNITEARQITHQEIRIEIATPQIAIPSIKHNSPVILFIFLDPSTRREKNRYAGKIECTVKKALWSYSKS